MVCEHATMYTNISVSRDFLHGAVLPRTLHGSARSGLASRLVFGFIMPAQLLSSFSLRANSCMEAYCFGIRRFVLAVSDLAVMSDMSFRMLK